MRYETSDAAHGGQSTREWLERLHEEGIAKAVELEDEPDIPSDASWYWSAYCYISRFREGFSGCLNPAAIDSYIHLYGVAGPMKDDLIRMIFKLEDHYQTIREQDRAKK